MLFKRTTIALTLAAALLAVAPAAPATSADLITLAATAADGAPSAPGVSATPVVSAAPGTTAVPGTWALVSWGFGRSDQHRPDKDGEPYHRSPYAEQFAYFGVNVGCGFIGGGIGLLNPIAGIFVGAGCGSGISA
jgi:hypothetical protein